MSARDDEIRRVVAELDPHIAAVEANVAALKALLADDEASGREDPRAPGYGYDPGQHLGPWPSWVACDRDR